MSVIFSNKVIINLSNTESIGSSIYNYSDLNKTKISSVSSTSSYFLSTNLELSKTVLNYLNCDNCKFVVDMKKTKQYIESIDKLLLKYNKNDFHGKLKDYYFYKDYYAKNINNYDLGFAHANIENGPSGRSYLRFDNEDENVKKFRGIIIAIFSCIVIENRESINYIYPVVKEEFQDMEHSVIKEEFGKYMLEVKGLNPKSVGQYIDVIDYTSDDAIIDGILDKSIYEYDNPEDVKNILETLRANDRFNTITFKRNHINTAAVGNYISFLEYSKTTPIKENNTNKAVETNNIEHYEKEISDLTMKLKKAGNNAQKKEIIINLIKNCYEMINHL